MAIASTQQIPNFTIGYSGKLIPPEGAKTLGPLACDWSKANLYPFSISNLAAQGTFSSVLCLFIDNAGPAASVTVTCGLTQQTVTIPKTSQGYVQVLMPNPGTFTVSSTAASGITNIFCMNFEVPSLVWSAV